MSLILKAIVHLVLPDASLNKYKMPAPPPQAVADFTRVALSDLLAVMTPTEHIRVSLLELSGLQGL